MVDSTEGGAYESVEAAIVQGLGGELVCEQTILGSMAIELEKGDDLLAEMVDQGTIWLKDEGFIPSVQFLAIANIATFEGAIRGVLLTAMGDGGQFWIHLRPSAPNDRFISAEVTSVVWTKASEGEDLAIAN